MNPAFLSERKALHLPLFTPGALTRGVLLARCVSMVKITVYYISLAIALTGQKLRNGLNFSKKKVVGWLKT